jgi:hypothetical protein
MATHISVPIISSWSSKVNWTQAGAAATALIVAFGVNLPDVAKDNVLVGITVAQAALTWVLRTWFTTSVTAASAENVKPTTPSF